MTCDLLHLTILSLKNLIFNEFNTDIYFILKVINVYYEDLRKTGRGEK